jgi:osmotically-inducible protein OsmY
MWPAKTTTYLRRRAAEFGRLALLADDPALRVQFTALKEGFERQAESVAAEGSRRMLKPAVLPYDVKRKIEAALQRNPGRQGSRIDVLANGGAVTLLGCVGTWREREIAEEATLSVPGVTAITDHLRVAPV